MSPNGRDLKPQNNLPYSPYQPQPSMPQQQQQYSQLQRQHVDSHSEHYDQYYSRNAAQRQRRDGLFIGIVSVVLLAVVGSAGAYYLYNSSKATPNTVFASAIGNSLSTTSVVQNASIDAMNTIEIRYDLSQTLDPHVDVHTKLDILDSKVDLRQWASIKNSYISIDEFSSVFDAADSVDYKSKWYQVKKAGKQIDTSYEDAGFSILFKDAEAHLFGDLLFANLQTSQKMDLQTYIVDQKVYAYNPDSVSEQTIDGRRTYVYDIKIDKNKRLEMNKKLAAIWNTEYTEPSPLLEDGDAQVQIFIDIDSKRIVKATSKSDNTTTTSTYSQYNSASVDKEPVAQGPFSVLNTYIERRADVIGNSTDTELSNTVDEEAI